MPTCLARVWRRKVIARSVTTGIHLFSAPPTGPTQSQNSQPEQQHRRQQRTRLPGSQVASGEAVRRRRWGLWRMPHMGMNVMNCSRRRTSAVAGRDLAMSAPHQHCRRAGRARTLGQVRVEQRLVLPVRLRVHAELPDLHAERVDCAGLGRVDAAVDEVPAATAVALDLVPAVEADAEWRARGGIRPQE